MFMTAFWMPHNFLVIDFKQLSTSLSIDAVENNGYQVPSAVMSSATTPVNASKALTIKWEPRDPTAEYYVYMHFAEVEELPANQSREFNISLKDEIFIGFVVPKYLYQVLYTTPSLLVQKPINFRSMGPRNQPFLQSSMHLRFSW